MDIAVFIWKVIVFVFWAGFSFMGAAIIVIVIRDKTFDWKVKIGSSLAAIGVLALFGGIANILAGMKVVLAGLIVGIILPIWIAVDGIVRKRKEGGTQGPIDVHPEVDTID